MRAISLLVFCLAGCGLLPTAAQADAALDRIKSRGKLLVSVKNEGERRQSAHKDPAHFAKRDFEIALAQAIAQRVLGSGDALELKLMPKPQRLPAVVSGEVDIAISMFKVTTAAARQVDFSTPYVESALAAMSLKAFSVDTLAALEGKRVALIERNDPGGAEVPEGFKPAAVLGFGRFEKAAEALNAGKVDALLSERQNILAFIDDGHAEFHASVPLVRTPVAVVLPKGNPDLKREVDAVIEGLRASGELARMATAAGLHPE